MNGKNHIHGHIFEGIPEEYRSQIALVEGSLHVSTTLRDEKKNINFLSNLAAKIQKSGLGGKIHFHDPSEFDRLYHARSFLSQSDVSDDSKVVSLAKQLIRQAYDKRATDIHIIELGNYAAIKMRVKGHLSDFEALDPQAGERLISVIFNSLSTSSGTSSFNKQARMDARIIHRGVLPPAVHSVRLHTEPIQLPNSGRNDGMGTFLAMRLLYDSTEASGTLEERLGRLGYLPLHTAVIRRLTQRGGLSIISGPTGSGKSTALKHIMERMVMESPDRSYFSVEDPPEYPIRGVSQIQVITNVKNDANFDARGIAYTEAIAGAMRSDPDVIMIGEIRYPQAAIAAIDAAQTGHSVWATIHANDAFGIVTRLESLLRAAEVNRPIEVLCESNVLTGLCYQRLIAILCPECKERWVDLPKDQQDKRLSMDLYGRLSGLKGFSDSDFDNIHLRGPGCPACADTGLDRMTVVAETIEMTPEILFAMKKGDKAEAKRIWLEQQKGFTYMDHAIQLIKSGEMDPEIAESRLGTLLMNAQRAVGGDDRV